MDQTVNKEFFDACASGDYAKVCATIAKGADVNMANGDGRTALMRAAKYRTCFTGQWCKYQS